MRVLTELGDFLGLGGWCGSRLRFWRPRREFGVLGDCDLYWNQQLISITLDMVVGTSVLVSDVSFNDHTVGLTIFSNAEAIVLLL